MLRPLVASVQLAAGRFHCVRHENHDLFLPPGDESPTKPPAADTTGYIHNEPLLAQVEPFSARIDGFLDLCKPLHTGGGGFPGNLGREPEGKGQRHGSSQHRGRIPTRVHLRQRRMAGSRGISAQLPNESQARGRLTAFQAVSQAGLLLLQLRGELRAKVSRLEHRADLDFTGAGHRVGGALHPLDGVAADAAQAARPSVARWTNGLLLSDCEIDTPLKGLCKRLLPGILDPGHRLIE